LKEIDIWKRYNKNIRFWMIFFKKNFKEKRNIKKINFILFQKLQNKEFKHKNLIIIKRIKTKFKHLKN